jgi:phage-related holin
MIVDILLPRRSETPPLSRWHYLGVIACLLVFYVTGFFWGEGGIPSLGSVILMLIIIGFFTGLLIWWVKKGETKKIERSAEKSRSAGVVTTLFAFMAALVSYFIQLTNWLSAPFLVYIADNVGAKRKLLISILLITFLFQGGFFYSSELLAIGVAGVSWASAIGGMVQITLLLIAKLN